MVEIGERVFFLDHEDNIQRGTVIGLPDDLSDIHIEVDPTFNRAHYATYNVMEWKVQPATENGLDRLRAQLYDFLDRCAEPYHNALDKLKNTKLKAMGIPFNYSVK
jgi:hypothetical protein